GVGGGDDPDPTRLSGRPRVGLLVDVCGVGRRVERPPAAHPLRVSQPLERAADRYQPGETLFGASIAAMYVPRHQSSLVRAAPLTGTDGWSLVDADDQLPSAGWLPSDPASSCSRPSR